MNNIFKAGFVLASVLAAQQGCATSMGDHSCVGTACGNDAASSPDVTFGDSSMCEQTCSDDLTSVVDCNGTVISTCSNGLACNAQHGCSDPCTAAESLGSSVGCQYAVPPPQNFVETAGACFAALVANAWTAPVKLQVSYGSRTLDVATIGRIAQGSNNVTLAPFPSDGKLPPGELAVLFLADRSQDSSGATACPMGVQAGVMDVDSSLNGSGIGTAFSITADAPIVAYDIYPYGGAKSYVTSASLLLPTSSWSQTYMGVHAFTNDSTLEGASTYLQIVANAPTQLTLYPTADIPASGGIAAGTKGQPYQATLDAGQFLEISGADLTGTVISANAPVAVVGGNSCMRIPIGEPACDSGHQQLLPVQSLGDVYVAARHRDRVVGANEQVPYRIMGIIDGTALSFDPPIAGAPASIDKGQLATVWTNKDFVVKSQDSNHPFYASGHMMGANNLASGDGGSNDQGDPDFVNLVTPAQFERSYLFLTDPTYANTHFVMTRKRGPNGFADVTLDCVGVVGGWTDVGTSGDYQIAKVDLVKDGAPVGACGNGVHRATSHATFGVTVWGWDVYVSYAYPAGTFIQKINSVNVVPN